MISRRFLLLGAFALPTALAACGGGEPQPRVVDSSSAISTIRIRRGIATQVELPEGQRATDITIGDPSIVAATSRDGVVTLSGTGSAEGQTNIIVRAVDDRGRRHTHQYLVYVEAR